MTPLNHQDAVALINRRRRQILVHGAMYYRLNENIISDHTYDAWCKELATLQIEYPEAAQEAPYSAAFVGFDGSTGFDLPIGEPEIVSKAHQLLKWHRKI